MKNKNRIFGIFLLVLSLFMCSSNLIYALHQNVLSGYKQVTNKGGSKSNTTDGITVSKIIEESNLENYFDITLTVNTTTKVEEVAIAPDLAVVLVIDTSKTMEDNKLGSQTRMTVAKNSAKNFIDNFYKYSSDSKSKTAIRKVGVVTFARDAKTIVSIQDCKNETQQTNIKNKITEITAQTGEKTQWTNMEAGLVAAQNMLASDAVKDVKNKYIIFLTDGLPTTYSTTEGGTTGYYPVSLPDPNKPRPTQTIIGTFFNAQRDLFATKGTDYSDLGARRAEERALLIRNNGTIIYSIGVGISTQKTMYEMLTDDWNVVDTDTEANNWKYYRDKSPYKVARYYAILPGVTDPTSKISTDAVAKKYKSRTYYKKWLGDYIASGYSKYYFDSEDKTELENAYAKIFTEITKKLEQETKATWVVGDPVGADDVTPNIEFLGLYDDKNVLKDSLTKGNTDQSDTATYDNNKISWNIKESNYDNTEKDKDGVTHYIYRVKYRVRIENESNTFNTTTMYKTNDITSLSYNIRKNGVLSDNKTINFPIPEVVGYLGEFTFTKKSSFDNTNLSGAKFKLSHNPNCLCHQERKFATISDFVQVSKEDGTVSFNNIPSGHSYVLEEIEAPKDHNLSNEKYDIIVSYGNVTGTPEDNIIVNELHKGNLEIQKLVYGKVTNPGEFEFILEVKYKNNKITGNYNYKLNNTTDGQIDLSSGIIKLKKDDKIVIYDLPVGATYSLKETTTNGFKVEYEVNSNGMILGETAQCNTNCRINLGDTNKVKFVNTADYILPATGSSTMLILTIMGSILLGMPVIYIGYSFYKRIRNIA